MTSDTDLYTTKLMTTDEYIKWAKLLSQEEENTKDMATLPNAYFFTFNSRSRSAKEIKNALSLKQLNSLNGLQDSIIVNWGSRDSNIDPTNSQIVKQNVKILNPSSVLNRTSNKLKFFQSLRKDPRINIPDFTDDFDEALTWIEEGHVVFGRDKVSTGGLDIISSDEIKNDPDYMNAFSNKAFYTKYKPKKHEYRVHMMNGEIIDYQRKALRTHDDTNTPINPNEVNFKIRNLRNGFVFIRQNVELPDCVREQAELAFKASGMDFGAIDLIYNSKENKAYVLEINSAPGLQGSTIESYAKGFKKHYPKFFDVEPVKEEEKKESKTPKKLKLSGINATVSNLQWSPTSNIF